MHVRSQCCCAKARRERPLRSKTARTPAADAKYSQIEKGEQNAKQSFASKANARKSNNDACCAAWALPAVANDDGCTAKWQAKKVRWIRARNISSKQENQNALHKFGSVQRSNQTNEFFSSKYFLLAFNQNCAEQFNFLVSCSRNRLRFGGSKL